ncbi:MAG: tRNA lysidine(34) synthetase TilS [Candidatus Omnitrophica bacterium]|nr:tRNA lysidine(34) synthetase TilS [Candidatus Omnitrophota bacterium]
MCLLHALFRSRQELGLELIVAHYDHHLRRTSARDRLFVEQAARFLDLPFVVEVNRCKVSKTGSIEDFARKQRYDFLVRAALKHGVDAIVTAHTRDDQAETVLLRIMRGTGLSGLQAILPLRKMNGVDLVRPLLIFSRHEVERFLQEIKVSFVNDPSNRSLDFTRNKVRRVLIPFLEKEFNPGIKDNLARLADTAAHDYSFIETQVALFLKRSLKKVGSNVSFSLKKYRSLHPSIRRMVLRSAFAALYGDAKPLTLAHIESMDTVLTDSGDPKKCCLPVGVCYDRRGERVIFSFDKMPA